MESNSNHILAIQQFFNFINLSAIEFNNFIYSFTKHFEDNFGKIQEVLKGYIFPPYQYNIYCQHWQHLYIRTEQYHILITFEANT